MRPSVKEAIKPGWYCPLCKVVMAEFHKFQYWYFGADLEPKGGLCNSRSPSADQPAALACYTHEQKIPDPLFLWDLWPRVQIWTGSHMGSIGPNRIRRDWGLES